MKCSKCNADNPIGARFCRSCGAGLEVKPQASGNFDSYLKRGYEPLSLARLKCSIWARVLFLILFVFFAIVAIGSLLEHINAISNPNLGLCGDAIKFMARFGHVVSFVALLLCIVLRFSPLFGLAFPNMSKLKSLQKKADYIQKYTSRSDGYTFIIKNGKYGLYDVKKLRIVFAPEYDHMEWKEKGKYLHVSKDGKWDIIDVLGNSLK